MADTIIKKVKSLGFPWETQNPFLFCVHHLDLYPEGNDELGPAESLAGRNLGNDFIIRDGWRMYHGDPIPGFPMHPHRGFETVTVVLQGFVDHSDSHGAAGRYGNGDVQWMTAGSGLQHAEMFPLLNKKEKNTLELFQIWLNLPAARKMVDPHFKMLWGEEIPVFKTEDKSTEVILIAGRIGDLKAPAPAPDSWAADPENELAIWCIKMDPGATWRIPAASPGLTASLFFFNGKSIHVAGKEFSEHCLLELETGSEIELKNGEEESQLLFLQAKPIEEPVVQYGPFVMNNQAEIRQAMTDYQQTRFGGWPWSRPDPVHGNEKGRFALYADGKRETPAE
jgi:redox-sensitive bicupin YhaK (pirin superfamily)